MCARRTALSTEAAAPFARSRCGRRDHCEGGAPGAEGETNPARSRAISLRVSMASRSTLPRGTAASGVSRTLARADSCGRGLRAVTDGRPSGASPASAGATDAPLAAVDAGDDGASAALARVERVADGERTTEDDEPAVPPGGCEPAVPAGGCESTVPACAFAGAGAIGTAAGTRCVGMARSSAAITPAGIPLT